MPKLYVAFRTNGEAAGTRVARGGIEAVKQELRQHIRSTWKLAVYKLKADVQTLCNVIEAMADPERVPYEGSLVDLYVNDAGQVREGTPSA